MTATAPAAPAKVYFTNLRTHARESQLDKLKRLIRRAGIEQIDFENKFVAIKIHFGELGNLSFLRPNYARAVADVVKELGGEKIDIVKWSEDVSEFISAALSPAKVVKVELLPGETRSCRVTVPDQQLSLAIGNKGQNARLCARLTGYNIDIRPESGYYGEDEEPKKKEEAADAE